MQYNNQSTYQKMIHREYARILIEFKSIPKHSRKKTFMEIAGYPHYENVCSNILKFYLDPKGDHGLGSLVFNSLMAAVDSDFTINKNLDCIEVYREYTTLNDNRIDLVLISDKYVIGIENKVFHHLHNDLNDYRRTIESLCHYGKKPICIVLSLNKIASADDLLRLQKSDFINITYAQIFSNIKPCIGEYLNNSTLISINYLSDFIRTIENLTPMKTENIELWSFFKHNAPFIQELSDSFNEYKESLFNKIYQLNDAVPKDSFAAHAEKQWIYKEELPYLLALVYDYIFKSKFKVSVDIKIDFKCWEIQVFGRNPESTEFLFKEMWFDSEFAQSPTFKNEAGDRIIYASFDTDTEVAIISKAIAELLEKIERYKQRTEANGC